MLGRRTAHRRAIGGEDVHFRPAAMARMHVHEGRIGNGPAHFIGIVGGDAGKADLLQHQRLDFRKLGHRAGDFKHLAFGRNDIAFLVKPLHPCRRHQPLDHADGGLEGRHHAPAHEHGKGHLDIAMGRHDARRYW